MRRWVKARTTLSPPIPHQSLLGASKSPVRIPGGRACVRRDSLHPLACWGHGASLRSVLGLRKRIQKQGRRRRVLMRGGASGPPGAAPGGRRVREHILQTNGRGIDTNTQLGRHPATGHSTRARNRLAIWHKRDSLSRRPLESVHPFPNSALAECCP